MFTIIAAIDKNNGIGLNGKIPWYIPSDLKLFKEFTTEKVVIMGSKTFDSLPEKNKPLKNRINIIITSRIIDNVICINNFNEALETAYSFNKKVFVIGGGQIYKIAILHSDCKELILTKIDKHFKCDTFFPNYDSFVKKEELLQGLKDSINYNCFLYQRK